MNMQVCAQACVPYMRAGEKGDTGVCKHTQARALLVGVRLHI